MAWWQRVRAERMGYLTDDLGYRYSDSPHLVPLPAGQAAIVVGLAPLCARMPRPRLAGVVLPERRPLPSGAADRARLALGKDGSWPLPLWPEEDSE